MKKTIQTENAPAAIGPYSQAVQVAAGQMLFTAGQIPLDPQSGEIIGENIESQTEQALKNLKAVLEAGGCQLSDVVKTTVFLANMGDFAGMNGVYAQYFAENPPARSAIEAAALPKNVLVEIECVAMLPQVN